MQTQKITLDFCQNDYKTVTVKQYDKDSRNLIITCTDNGAFYKLDSSTLQCNVKMNTPDDRAIYDTATIREDGTVLVTFSESMVYANGTGKLEIQFLDSSTKKSISTMILTVIIIGSVYPDDKIIASDEFNALTDALLKIESDVNAAGEAIERINTLEENVTTAEASRVTAEESRVLAESKRVSAENTRIANENTRKTNETTRQTAESKRQTDTATAIANAEEATEKANKIAENCKDLMLGSGISIITTETTLEGSKDGLIRIESIGGESEQDSTAGNQLWNGKYVTVALNKEQDNFVADSTMAGNLAMPVTVGKQYTFSINGELAQIRYIFVDADGVGIGSLANASTTVVAPENAVYMKWRVNSYHAETDKIMLNEGTTALPYEQYTGGQPAPNPSYPQEIKKTVVSEIRTYWKNIVKTCSYRATATNSYALVRNVRMPIKKGLTYTISVELTADSDTKAYWHNGTGLFGNHVYLDVLAGTHRYSHTFKAQADYLYGENTILAKRATSDNILITPKKLMVELGDTATEYEPYTESSHTFSQPIELYGMNGVQDVITAKPIKRRFDVAVFDGSDDEGWTYESGANYSYSRIIQNKVKRPTANDEAINMLCSHLIVKTFAAVYYGTDGIAVSTSGSISVKHPDLTSLSEWIAYLQANPMTLVYELAEEVTEELPTADQIGLNSLLSFDGITYISTDSEVEPIITTEYGTSKTSAHAIEALNKVDNTQIIISEIEENIAEIEEDIADLQNAQDITTITSTTLSNGYTGRLKIEEIGGVTEQNSTAGNQLWSYGDISSGSISNIPWSISAGEYTFSTATTSFELTIRVYYEDNSEEVFVFAQSPTTFTLKKNVVKCNYNSYVAITDVMVNKGTTALPFEKYTGGIPAPNPSYSMPIKNSKVKGIRTHWKNFLDSRNFKTITSSGITYTPVFDSDGNLEYINVNGTATYQSSYSLALGQKMPTTRQIVLNGCKGGSSETYCQVVGYFDENMKWKTESNQAENDLLINRNYAYYEVYIIVRNGVTVNNVKFYPMIREYGTDATYEPYTESTATLSQPIELYNFGGVQDVIEDGKVTKRIASLTLNGSETWYKYSPDYNLYLVETGININGNKRSYCSHFRYSSGNLLENLDECRPKRGDVVQTFYVSSSQYTSVEDFKSFLASNPITVCFYLAEEVVEELPIADQVGLNSLATYDGITYVEFDSEIQPTFKAEYGTSKVGGYTLESLLVARNNELKLNALEAMLASE